MIIRDNFNKNDANPLTDYDSIGPGSHSPEKEMEKERRGFIRANLSDKVLESLRDNHDDTEDRDEDDWKFFRDK